MSEGFKVIFDDKEKASKKAKEFLKKLDFNGNSSLDFSEFMIANLESSKLLEEDTLTEIFSVFDRNSHGVITGSNLKKVLG